MFGDEAVPSSVDLPHLGLAALGTELGLGPLTPEHPSVIRVKILPLSRVSDHQALALSRGPPQRLHCILVVLLRDMPM